ncbi:MAG: peptidoglycan recognition family protein [Bacteroidota bacterium]
MYFFKISIIICLVGLLSSCTASRYVLQEGEVINRPIPFGETRTQLSLEYIKEHHDLVWDKPVIDPKIVVVHHTAIPTLEGTFQAFDPETLNSYRKEIATASALNVGIQYVVDRDGTIYQTLPDTLFARHVIGLNYCSIGIENVGGTAETPLTAAQLRANVKLIAELAKRHDIEYMIGHDEYKAFKLTQHPLWRETDPNYFTEKNDPGPKFMKKLRKRLKDYELKGPPVVERE